MFVIRNATNELVCPSGDGCSYQLGSKYLVARCTFDVYGGDTPQGISKQAKLKLCIDQCAATQRCVAVSYAADTSCYVTSELKPARYSDSVNSMFMLWMWRLRH